MRWMWLLVLGCSTPAPIAVHAGDLAITDVTVIPMSRPELAHHTVIIRDDRIVAVAPSAMLTLQAGIKVIDGKGKWLMPGLADMHVHVFGDDQLAMLVAAGVTTVRNMYGSEQHLAWRGRTARGELLGPTIVTAGVSASRSSRTWGSSSTASLPRRVAPKAVIFACFHFRFFASLKNSVSFGFEPGNPPSM